MDEPNHVSVSFFTQTAIRSEEFARAFFRVLCQHNQVFIPQEFDGGASTGHHWVPFKPTTHDLAVQAWRESGHALMRRKEPMQSRITVSMHFAASGGFNTVAISVDEQYLERRDHVTAFLDLCLALYGLLHPVYGLVHDVGDKLATRTVIDPKLGRTVMPTNLRKGLPGIYWANFLGPEYVAMLGKEFLRSAPCFQMQELPDGGILVLTSQSPLAPSSADNRHAQHKLRKYLGEDIFYPSDARTTRAPEFKCDPSSLSIGRDLLVNHDLDTAKKRAKAQNLIDNAEELAYLLIDELASQSIVLDHSPGSLHILDQELLQKREAGEVLNEFSAKMFAAYAGEVIKQALHGQWVVDEITGDAAVQIQDMRVFPMARVFKFWESEEMDTFATILGILGALG